MPTRTIVVITAMVVGALSTASMSHGVDVKVDYDPTVDFSLFKTISWREGTPAEDPEVENRIHAAIERELVN